MHALSPRARQLAVATTLALGLVALSTSCSGSGASACGGYRKDKVVRIGSHRIDAEVVDTESTLEKGLGGRKCIGPDQGMLFVFKEPGVHSFGMQGMKFPIDMVWLGADRTVVWQERNVSPSTSPTSFFNRNDPAQYVLELKAGTARKLGLKIGSPVSF
jgi:uncharacterized membrane protein (UPF0127 family)